MSENRGSIVGGVILIMLGVAFLAMQVLGDSAGALVPLGIGVAFLVSHFAYRSYGFLVPGGILVGLGSGLLVEQLTDVPGEPVVLGMGLGFLLIFVVDRTLTHAGPPEGSWWPLIPGGILTLVGAGTLVPGLSEAVLRYGWPVAFIVGGLLIVWRGIRNRSD